MVHFLATVIVVSLALMAVAALILAIGRPIVAAWRAPGPSVLAPIAFLVASGAAAVIFMAMGWLPV
jgi:hypothetical protein